MLPIEKSVLATDDSTSPPARVTVLFRYETQRGELEYSESPNSPIYDGSTDDVADVSPPESEDPLFVDEALHEWLSGRYADVTYTVHACDDSSSLDESDCRSHSLTRSAFNDFTLEDAIVLGNADGGAPTPVRRVDEGAGMRSEVVESNEEGSQGHAVPIRSN